MGAASLAEPTALLISIYCERRVARAGEVLRVPPRVALILAALFVGRLMSTSDLVDMLYSDDPNGGPDLADRIVNQEMRTARIAGAVLGFVIHASHGRGYSARLVEVHTEAD
jgi:hypothetical protein